MNTRPTSLSVQWFRRAGVRLSVFGLLLFSLNGLAAAIKTSDEIRALSPIYADVSRDDIVLLQKYAPPGFLEFYARYTLPIFNDRLQEGLAVRNVINNLDLIKVPEFRPLLVRFSAVLTEDRDLLRKLLDKSNVRLTHARKYDHMPRSEVIELVTQESIRIAALYESKIIFINSILEKKSPTLRDVNLAADQYSLARDIVVLEDGGNIIESPNEHREIVEGYFKGTSFSFYNREMYLEILKKRLEDSGTDSLKGIFPKHENRRMSDPFFPRFPTLNDISVRTLNFESIFPFTWESAGDFLRKPDGQILLFGADGFTRLPSKFRGHDKAHRVTKTDNFTALLGRQSLASFDFQNLLTSSREYAKKLISISVQRARLRDQFRLFLNKEKLSFFERGIAEILLFDRFHEAGTTHLSNLFDLNHRWIDSANDRILERLSRPLNYGGTFQGARQVVASDLVSIHRALERFFVEFVKTEKGRGVPGAADCLKMMSEIVPIE